jgi:hypothetical protein
MGLQKDLSGPLEQDLWAKKGLYHFILGQFEQAHQSFQKVYDARKEKAIRTLCEKWMHRKKDREELSDVQLTELLHDLKLHKDKEAFTMVDRRLKKGQKKNFKLIWDFISVTLQKLNKTHESLERPFKIQAAGNHLDLSGSKMQFFLSPNNRKLNYLQVLNLNSLDLSNSSFKDINELAGLDLVSLDLSGCQLKKTTASTWISLKKNRMPNLKKITLDKEFLGPLEIKAIEKTFEEVHLNQ